MSHRSGKRGGRGKIFGGDGQSRRDKKGYLPEETMGHYRRISDALSQLEQENGEEKSDFLNNIFSGLAEEVVQVSQNQTVSSIIESLIAVGSPSNLRTLFVALAADLSIAFLDRFACHVFEKLTQKLPQFFYPPTQNSTDEEEDYVSQDKFVESFEGVCEFVDSNFETLMTHMYGSHVLRALLEALSGVPVVNELKKSQKSGHGRYFNKEAAAAVSSQKPPEHFKELFDRYAKKIFRMCDYEVHLKDPYFSLMLQAVLMIWHKVNVDLCQQHCQTIVQKLVEFCPQSDEPSQCIPDPAQDAAGSHLLEVVFKLSSPEILQHVFDSLLSGKLLYYAIHPVANYVLQRFISSVKDVQLMEKVFEELSKNLEDVFAVGYFGLVISLAEGCRRLQVKEDEFVMCLMETFHCKEPAERQKPFVKLIVSLTAFEVFYSLKEGMEKPSEESEEPHLSSPLNIHGSLLLQELLQFRKPKHTALGLLDLQREDLQLLCCDPSGSHVVDVFFSSPSVLPKNKDNLVKKLKDLLVEIACTKNGSRCLESVWNNLNIDMRTLIAKELSQSDRLRSDRFGHFLFRNFNLGLFTSKRKGWLEQQRSQIKRKRIMKELLHGNEPPTKKKKSNEEEMDVQPKEEEQDSITAMFLNQKKRKDSNPPASPKPHKTRSEDPSPSRTVLAAADRDSPGAKRKKEKKKKGKSKTGKAPVEISADVGEMELGDGEIVGESGYEEEMPSVKTKDKKKKEKSKKEKSLAEISVAVPLEQVGDDGEISKESGHGEEMSSVKKKDKKKKDKSKKGKPVAEMSEDFPPKEVEADEREIVPESGHEENVSSVKKKVKKKKVKSGSI